MYEIVRDNGAGGMAVKVSIPFDAKRHGYNITRVQSILKDRGRMILQRLRTSQRDAFAYEGHQHHGGRSWRKLRPLTIDKKGHGRVLFETGKMMRRQSLLGRFSYKAGHITGVVNAKNNSPYAHFHQFGFLHVKSGKWVGPRPPAWLSEADATFIEQSIRNAFPGSPPAGRQRKRRRR